jgi:anti-sigma B factor antagonist
MVLTGELELANCARVREAAVSLLAQSTTRIVMDLSGLSFIDSSGVGVVIGTLKRARERQGAFALVCANPTILRVLEITGLTQVLSIHATQAEAEQALGEGGPS